MDKTNCKNHIIAGIKSTMNLMSAKMAYVRNGNNCKELLSILRDMNVQFEMEMDNLSNLEEQADGCYVTAIILSPINLDDIFIKNHSRFGVCAELCPFGDLHNSQIIDLFDLKIDNPQVYKDIEFAYMVEEKYGLISSGDPTKFEKWYMYSSDQKKIISKYNSLNKKNRFFNSNANVINLRNRKEIF